MLMQEEAMQREELKVKLPQANFVYHGNSNAGSSGGKAPKRSKGYRFYCPNHSTRIVESGNARFIEHGRVHGSVGARDVEIRESLMDQNPSSDLSQVDVPIIVAQPQGMNMKQQQMDASNPIMDAIVKEDEENAQVNEQVQPQEEIALRRVQIVHIGTNDMIADPLTKGLAPKTFIDHVSEMGVVAKSLYSG
ncbi:hypothetical protein V6N12_010080 [Hibiscus sabdariffa]|uniref:Uncharacterized protein n=1 Tax=Hibiscus sabdariffa TaxID=183260 RepID=A0ABR2ECM8_9ROSI